MPEDTDGLSPIVTSYSRTCKWENDTLRPTGLFFSLLRLIDLLLSHGCADDNLSLLPQLDIDPEAEVRHDVRVPAVSTRRTGVVADDAVNTDDLEPLAGRLPVRSRREKLVFLGMDLSSWDWKLVAHVVCSLASPTDFFFGRSSKQRPRAAVWTLGVVACFERAARPAWVAPL